MSALNEKAVLVSLKGTTWKATVPSKKGTEATAETHGTTEEWVNTSVRLVRKAVLEGPQKVLGAARNYLDGKSFGPADGQTIGGLPLWDNGRRILPNALNETVSRNLGEYKSRFFDRVDDLRAALPAAIDAARTENPDLFNETDYGSIDDIIERYTFSVEYDLIPDANDIRVDASKEFVDSLRAEVQGRSDRKLKEVTDKATATIISVAGHFAERCEVFDPENKGASPFRNSTVNKVRDLIGVLPALNISGDARIEKARQDLIGVIGNKSAKEFREDDEVREDAAAKARAVAANISSLFD
jgi:hypothetical protein